MQRNHITRFDFGKIDIEGKEFEVLDAETIGYFDRVAIEVHGVGYEVESLKRRFQDSGFNVVSHKGKGVFGSQNYLYAVRKDV